MDILASDNTIVLCGNINFLQNVGLKSLIIVLCAPLHLLRHLLDEGIVVRFTFSDNLLPPMH